jgi:hypothetical protein
VILASNFNKTGMNFSQGDFNHDDKVNALDFNTIATKYGTYLAPILLAPRGEAPETVNAAKSAGANDLFTDKPITPDAGWEDVLR